MASKLTAEFIGTFWLVLGGCGSAVLAAAFPDVGIGLLGVSLAFGLTVLSGAYALGPISGGHFNPAVSVGLCVGGRFPAALLLPYAAAQVIGGLCGAGVLYIIASGNPSFSLAGGFASNGYGAHSPGGYSLASGLVCEVVMTFMFLIDHPRRHAQARDNRVRRPGDRPGAHAGPSDQHPGDKHLGESGAQYRDGPVRGRLGDSAALAVLDCAYHRRSNRWVRIQDAPRGSSPGSSSDRTRRGVVGIAGLAERTRIPVDPKGPASSYAIAVAICLVAFAAPLAAQGIEFMPFGGYRFGGDFFELVADRPADIDGAPAVGFVVNVPLSDGLQVEAFVTRQSARVSLPTGPLQAATRWHFTIDHMQAGGLREFSGGRVRPFLTGLLGLTRYAAEGTGSEIRFTAGAGGGVKLFPVSHFGLRLDGRLYTTFVDADLRFLACTPGTCITAVHTDLVWQTEFTAGLIVRLP